MQIRTFIQLFLFLIIILISFLFFKTYFTEKAELKKIKPPLEKKNPNVIENISYISEDNEGNKYVIKSEFAQMNNDSSDLIIMRNVKATMEIKNSSLIEIYSKRAIYNTRTYDTNFFNDVKLKYDEHFIESNILELEFQKNLVTISDNIVYNYLNTSLEADKIEINLITKNSKIFMNNKSKSVIVKTIN
jgi:hypothetical protein